MKTEAGWRTVARLRRGAFNMVIHAPRRRRASTALKDYNITVTSGYIFEHKTDIFSAATPDGYVQIKRAMHDTKSEPMRRSRLNCY